MEKVLFLSLESTGGDTLRIIESVDSKSLSKEFDLSMSDLLVIDEEDIKKILQQSSIKDLNTRFQKFSEQHDINDYYPSEYLAKFFEEEFNSNNIHISYPADYVTISSQEGRIFFDCYYNVFEMAEDYLVFEQTYYNHWDGNNFQKYLVYETIELTLDNNYLDLDICYNNNYHLPSQKFVHGSLYKILKYVDMDSKEENKFYKNMFLYKEWTQYQGDFVIGEILDERAVINKIISLYEDTPFEDETDEKIKEFESMFL